MLHPPAEEFWYSIFIKRYQIKTFQFNNTTHFTTVFLLLHKCTLGCQGIPNGRGAPGHPWTNNTFWPFLFILHLTDRKEEECASNETPTKNLQNTALLSWLESWQMVLTWSLKGKTDLNSAIMVCNLHVHYNINMFVAKPCFKRHDWRRTQVKISFCVYRNIFHLCCFFKMLSAATAIKVVNTKLLIHRGYYTVSKQLYISHIYFIYLIL